MSGEHSRKVHYQTLAMPALDWRGIRGLGNVLRHEYDAVDDSTIEGIVERELGPLRQACVSELALRHGDERAR